MKMNCVGSEMWFGIRVVHIIIIIRCQIWNRHWRPCLSKHLCHQTTSKNLNPYFVHLLPSYKDYQEMLFYYSGSYIESKRKMDNNIFTKCVKVRIAVFFFCCLLLAFFFFWLKRKIKEIFSGALFIGKRADLLLCLST